MVVGSHCRLYRGHLEYTILIRGSTVLERETLMYTRFSTAVLKAGVLLCLIIKYYTRASRHADRHSQKFIPGFLLSLCE